MVSSLLSKRNWMKLTKKHSPENPRVPVSLAYHLADIYIEELDKPLEASEDPLPAPLSTPLEPFLTLAAHALKKTTYERLLSALFELLLSVLSPSALSEDEGGERSQNGRGSLAPSLSMSLRTLVYRSRRRAGCR